MKKVTQKISPHFRRLVSTLATGAAVAATIASHRGMPLHMPGAASRTDSLFPSIAYSQLYIEQSFAAVPTELYAKQKDKVSDGTKSSDSPASKNEYALASLVSTIRFADGTSVVMPTVRRSHDPDAWRDFASQLALFDEPFLSRHTKATTA